MAGVSEDNPDIIDNTGSWRWCTGCEDYLLYASFYQRKGRTVPTGRCKVCATEYAKERQRKHREGIVTREGLNGMQVRYQHTGPAVGSPEHQFFCEVKP
jgi:hypothetical protein